MPPLDPAHQARLERELLAAYDTRMGARAWRGRSPWWRYATAIGFLLCLVTATQVTAEYKEEMGKRLQVVWPAGQTPPPDLGEKVARALMSGPERPGHLEVGVMLRRSPQGPTTLVVDVWGDRFARDDEGLARLRALPELAGLPLDVTSLKGRVRGNLWGLVGHSLFRANSSPEERARARQRLMEELRRQEGDEAQIDVDVDPDPQAPRMRIKVRKQGPLPPPPSE